VITDHGDLQRPRPLVIDAPRPTETEQRWAVADAATSASGSLDPIQTAGWDQVIDSSQIIESIDSEGRASQLAGAEDPIDGPESFGSMRRMLCADSSLEQWVHEHADAQFDIFGEALRKMQTGEFPGARAAIRRLLDDDSEDSRGIIQAWRILRELGEMTEGWDAQRVLGAIARKRRLAPRSSEVPGPISGDRAAA
jgi:hypothetical protein